MPDAGGKALIEGTETMVFYTAWILFPEHIDFLFGLFGILVVTTILQRAAWAIQHLWTKRSKNQSNCLFSLVHSNKLLIKQTQSFLKRNFFGDVFSKYLARIFDFFFYTHFLDLKAGFL